MFRCKKLCWKEKRESGELGMCEKDEIMYLRRCEVEQMPKQRDCEGVKPGTLQHIIITPPGLPKLIFQLGLEEKLQRRLFLYPEELLINFI